MISDAIEESINFNKAFTFDYAQKITQYESDSNYVNVMPDGVGFDYSYFQNYGFKTPIIFLKSDGIKMRMPSSKFSIEDLKRLIGSKTMLNVFEVTTQQPLSSMSMKDFATYFTTYSENEHGMRCRHYLINLISLEFSGTRLDDYVQPPHFIHKLDWIDTAWPQDMRESAYDKMGNLIRCNWPKVIFTYFIRY